MSRSILRHLSLLCAFATLPAAGAAISVPFLFDAPGASSSPLTVGLALGLVLAPVVAAVSAGLAYWAARRARSGLPGAVALAMPLALLAYLAVVLHLLSTYCQGRLTCT